MYCSEIRSARRALYLSLLALFCGTAGCGGPRAWTVDSALKKARQANRIVFVEFWSFVLPECIRMDAEVLSDPLLKQDLEDFVRVRVDYLLHGDLAKRCGVTRSPGFAALRPDGTLIASQMGFADRDTMQRFLIRAKVFR